MDTSPQSRSAVGALIPHAGDMILLDRVLQSDAATIVCETSTHRVADNPLRHNGALPASAAIEYAAQAAALHAAMAKNGTPGRGVLAVVSDVSWTTPRLDALPSPMLVRAERLAAMSTGFQYAFSVGDEAAPAVSGTLIVAFDSES